MTWRDRCAVALVVASVVLIFVAMWAQAEPPAPPAPPTFSAPPRMTVEHR